jgi:hypothetical protein
MEKLNCYCGVSFEVETHDNINLDENPEIISKILNNHYMEYVCPSCEKILKPEYRIRVYDKNMDLAMFPEIERDSLLTGKIKITSKQIVIGYNELREKILIRELDYDDRVIELIKLYLLNKIVAKREIKIFLMEENKDNIVFHIHGIKKNETGISKIPKHIYNNISNNIEERMKEPAIKELLSFPYRSINTIRTEVR